MTAIPGTLVIAPITTGDTQSIFATHDAVEGRGGLTHADTVAARDAIPVLRRRAGMLCYVGTTGLTYQLQPDLVTWAEFAGGSGTTYLAGFGDASPAVIYNVPVGTALLSIAVEVTEVWDGAGASIQIGVAGDPEKYFASADTELTELVSFSKSFSELGPVELIVTINPGTSPSSGRVRIQVATTVAGT